MLLGQAGRGLTALDVGELAEVELGDVAVRVPPELVRQDLGRRGGNALVQLVPDHVPPQRPAHIQVGLAAPVPVSTVAYACLGVCISLLNLTAELIVDPTTQRQALLYMNMMTLSVGGTLTSLDLMRCQLHPH